MQDYFDLASTWEIQTGKVLAASFVCCSALEENTAFFHCCIINGTIDVYGGNVFTCEYNCLLIPDEEALHGSISVLVT